MYKEALEVVTATFVVIIYKTSGIILFQIYNKTSTEGLFIIYMYNTKNNSFPKTRAQLHNIITTKVVKPRSPEITNGESEKLQKSSKINI